MPVNTLQTLAPLDVPPAQTVNVSASSNVAVATTTFANATPGNLTMTLPDATTIPGRKLVVILSVTASSHTCSFATVDSQTINAAAASSLTALSTVGTGYIFLSDGANYWAASGVG